MAGLLLAHQGSCEAGDIDLVKTFSERKGLKPVSEESSNRLDERGSEKLTLERSGRRSLVHGGLHPKTVQGTTVEPLSQLLWFHYFKKPIDSRPHRRGSDSRGDPRVPVLM